MVDSEGDILKILVATNLHVVDGDKLPVQGEDSFILVEILVTGGEQEVDSWRVGA